MVNEVLPAAELLPRALALAAQLAKQPTLAARYARALFTQPYRRLLAQDAGYGLALEGLSAAGLQDPRVP